MARKKKQKAEAVGFDAAGVQRSRLTPVDVQEKVFRVSMRGYNEQDVDEFLDHITEDLAALYEENKRLREQVEHGGGGGDSIAEAQRKAAEIVSQARAEATRLAEQPGGAGAAPAPTAYLVRERDFLQQLAALVQQHAETLKAEARKRSAGAAAAAPGSQQEPAAAASARPATPASAPPAVMPAKTDEATQTHDPLLDEWEEGFSGGQADEPVAGDSFFGEPAETEGRKGEEPSLKELFWGDE